MKRDQKFYVVRLLRPDGFLYSIRTIQLDTVSRRSIASATSWQIEGRDIQGWPFCATATEISSGGECEFFFPASEAAHVQA